LDNYQSIINSALAKSTWKKYSSAYSLLQKFVQCSGISLSWPLPVDTCRSFVVWCHEYRRLKKATIKTYLSGIRFIHVLKGLPFSQSLEDELVNLLLKGVSNRALQAPNQGSSRRAVTLPLLLVLGEKIASSPWRPLNKQVVWAAATTAFFASARMGEILAKAARHHSKEDLTWADVRESSETSLLLRLKCPKSGERQEFVDLFPFPGYNCCPVAALRALKAKQRAAGMAVDNQPVFRFASGVNLTMPKMNKTLAALLREECRAGENTISCHSFRAGIPTTLALLPGRSTDGLIKGWGRWKSNAFTRYTKLKMAEKSKMFESISRALIATV
jgi:Phage integrase SAM-like domain